MRKIYLVFILVLAINCKKDKRPACQMISLQNSNSPQTINYQYDNQGRITKVFDNTFAVNLSYFKDSIQLSSGNTITTYFLNSGGQALSAKTRYLVNPNMLSLESIYAYDNNGYLINSREIFSQVYNGNLIKDTSFQTFTIQNGNIVKNIRTVAHVEYEQRFEYNSKEAKSNIAFMLKVSESWPFLGKPSKNLISAVRDDRNNLLYTYSYDFDGAKNIVKKTAKGPDNAVLASTQYNYQCQ